MVRVKRELRLILPFVAILFTLVSLSDFSLDILSAARAYVAGESLWSKAQKDAVIHLMRYAYGHDEAEYGAFQHAIAVTFGDRAARIELTRANPDYGKAVAGLLAGGNHPDDIPGMIRLIRDFGRLPAIARAVGIWARGDDEVTALNDEAKQLHEVVQRGGDVAPLLERIQATDARVTPLEQAFSYSLGQISRQMRGILVPVTAVVAALLLFLGITIVLRDVRRETRHTAHLAHLASHDPLTGVFNRIEFERCLSNAIEEVHRDGCTHALMYLDLDEFKVVNDTCGHAGGDELIRQIATIMRTRQRHTDTLARLGGDEFGVLLLHCDAHGGVRLAEEIRAGISQHRFACGQRTFSLGVSIGMLTLDQTVTNVAQALSAADAACYRAKQEGKNCVQVYS